MARIDSQRALETVAAVRARRPMSNRRLREAAKLGWLALRVTRVHGQGETSCIVAATVTAAGDAALQAAAARST